MQVLPRCSTPVDSGKLHIETVNMVVIYPMTSTLTAGENADQNNLWEGSTHILSTLIMKPSQLLPLQTSPLYESLVNIYHSNFVVSFLCISVPVEVNQTKMYFCSEPQVSRISFVCLCVLYIQNKSPLVSLKDLFYYCHS